MSIPSAPYIDGVRLNPAGEISPASGNGCGRDAEGATAPETLRQTDRWVTALWKAEQACGSALTEGVRPVANVPVQSLRFHDRGGVPTLTLPGHGEVRTRVRGSL
ncbi:MAG: hypothetical protein DHS20C03_18480 [Minwuia thermotolerans]|nr:MAG: hypothetical protein DHS20C03_18480 [Minwuia thermotolerans]